MRSDPAFSAGESDDSVTLVKQQFGEERAILSRNAGNECSLRFSGHGEAKSCFSAGDKFEKRGWGGSVAILRYYPESRDFRGSQMEL